MRAVPRLQLCFPPPFLPLVTVFEVPYAGAKYRPGRPGGVTGGPTGTRIGSIDGSATCSLNGLPGLMMMGGMAGGAEGGLLGPFPFGSGGPYGTPAWRARRGPVIRLA